MKKALLIRTSTSDHGTFGVMTTGTLSLFSGELPWRNNQRGVSCIPEGTYRCSLRYSPAFKRNLYIVNNVPNRNYILIHSANLMGNVEAGLKSQLNGCLSLGERRGFIEGQRAILSSLPAVRRFMQALNEEPFDLTIVNEFKEQP